MGNVTPPTAGPWKYESGCVWSDEKGCLLMADRGNPKTTPTERDANVRLAHASRDLLEACEFAAKYLGPNDPSDGAECWNALFKLEDAIKKAKGIS